MKVQTPSARAEEVDHHDVPAEGPASPGLSVSEPKDDPELELLVFGARHKIKRSELVKTYDLGSLPDEHIIKVAQKEMAADQRLREAKEAADQRLSRCPDQPLLRPRRGCRSLASVLPLTLRQVRFGWLPERRYLASARAFPGNR